MVSDLEEEGLEHTLGWTESDDEFVEEFIEEHMLIGKLETERCHLVARMHSGGRVVERPQKGNAWYRNILMGDLYGFHASEVNNVPTPSRQAFLSEKNFKRRYRVNPTRFAQLLHDIQLPDTGKAEFRKGHDCTKRDGPDALQLMVTCFRILAYGFAFDAIHAYTGVTENLARNGLYAFCDWIISNYSHVYLPVWTKEAVQKEMEKNRLRGFAGMLGSIDCQHWRWKNCPKPLHGQYQNRKHEKTVIVEAVCGHDLFFWHAFFGSPGAWNDKSVLANSTISGIYSRSPAATTTYSVNGQQFEGAFLLADGIYPSYAWLMKTIPLPRSAKDKLFAE